MRDEVLIAGAGPAGAIAALLLARAGVRVRLLDRAIFPRDKLCGDTVNPGTLEILRRLGIAGIVERDGVPIQGMVVTGAGGERVRGEYGAGIHGVSLLRRELDWLLVRHAIGAGASFEPGVLVQEPLVEEAGGRRRVTGLRVVSRTGASHDLRAGLTIAADGRRSRLAFHLGLAKHPERPRRWAIGGYFDDVACPDGVGEMHIRCGRYIGVAPVPGGLTNACIVVDEPRCGALAEPGALLRATLQADPLLRDRFAEARLVSAPAVLGPLAVDTTAAGTDGLLLAGDAAGFIDPMTGDGLFFAVRGAELAADVAQGLLGGSVADGPLELAARRQQAFMAKWRMNRVLRALVASPRAMTWAARGARICPAAVRHLIARAGDVSADARQRRFV
ncbi:MAG TPA: FAD-dependent monooxygenase [Vicinamibacterales bacterium]|jgi:flavin-dependent dehydrogenase|nr:FAD-dependent monooxygenase [Vicinamibacterales bacterium]